jgi:hypothetical protein
MFENKFVVNKISFKDCFWGHTRPYVTIWDSTPFDNEKIHSSDHIILRIPTIRDDFIIGIRSNVDITDIMFAEDHFYEILFKDRTISLRANEPLTYDPPYFAGIIPPIGNYSPCIAIPKKYERAIDTGDAKIEILRMGGSQLETVQRQRRALLKELKSLRHIKHR